MAGMIREGIAKADLEPTKICLHWIEWCGMKHLGAASITVKEFLEALDLF